MNEDRNQGECVCLPLSSVYEGSRLEESKLMCLFQNLTTVRCWLLVHADFLHGSLFFSHFRSVLLCNTTLSLVT